MPEELEQQQLRITTSVEAAALIVNTAGEIDAHSAERLREALLEGVNANQSVVVDMADVTFIDSSGLRALIGAYKSAQDGGLSLTIRQPSDSVLRLLEITGQRERFLPSAE